MLGKIKRLGTETLIYGIMTVVGRFLTFLLVPFYTNVLPPDAYGIVAYLYSLIALATIFFSYGMEAAYFKYASAKEIGDDRQNFSTPFFSLLATSLVLACVLTALSGSIAAAVDISAEGTNLILLSVWILFFDTIALVPFASLRLRHKAALFAVIKLVNISVNVSLNIYFLTVLELGVKGVFLAGLVSSVITALILIPVFYRQVTLKISLKLWKELMKFGLPYVPAGIATLVLQVIDRPILRALTDNETVGIYQANYRLGIVMMLLVSTFDYAYRPFFLNHARDPEAKELYARIATYFSVVMVFVWLAITLFVGDIVAIRVGTLFVIHPDYWSGLTIIPLVSLAYLFTGWSTLLTPGIFIRKKTVYLPVVTGIAAVSNIAANLLLIPILGIHGAALATLISYVLLAAGMYIVSQRIYRITYEAGRLSVLAIIFLLTGVLSYYTAFIHDPGIFVRLLILTSFPILILITGFLNSEELDRLRALKSKFKRR
jgi:O-antigen/teichoic acid export membrane protein